MHIDAMYLTESVGIKKKLIHLTWIKRFLELQFDPKPTIGLKSPAAANLSIHSL